MSEDVSYSIIVKSLSARRAWIEILLCSFFKPSKKSLSARRAWIEILSRDADGAYLVVALRKESVDRNKIGITPIDSVSRSLSARRAWIEICWLLAP